METKNKKQKIPAATEEHAVILDYLSLGYVNSDMSKFKGKAIAQAIGTDYFTLLELVPKRGALPQKERRQVITEKTVTKAEKEKETKYIKFLENQTMKT